MAFAALIGFAKITVSVPCLNEQRFVFPILQRPTIKGHMGGIWRENRGRLVQAFIAHNLLYAPLTETTMLCKGESAKYIRSSFL